MATARDLTRRRGNGRRGHRRRRADRRSRLRSAQQRRRAEDEFHRHPQRQRDVDRAQRRLDRLVPVGAAHQAVVDQLRANRKDVLEPRAVRQTARKALSIGRDRRRCTSFRRQSQDRGHLRGDGLPLHRPDRRPRLRCPVRRHLQRAAHSRPGAAARAHRQRQGLRAGRERCAHVSRRGRRTSTRPDEGRLEKKSGRADVRPSLRRRADRGRRHATSA